MFHIASYISHDEISNMSKALLSDEEKIKDIYTVIFTDVDDDNTEEIEIEPAPAPSTTQFIVSRGQRRSCKICSKAILPTAT